MQCSKKVFLSLFSVSLILRSLSLLRGLGTRRSLTLLLLIFHTINSSHSYCSLCICSTAYNGIKVHCTQVAAWHTSCSQISHVSKSNCSSVFEPNQIYLIKVSENFGKARCENFVVELGKVTLRCQSFCC